MSRFVILLGGEFFRTPRVDAQVAGARVIAADSGIRHATTLGVVPELWIGDFDSVSDELAGGMAAMCRARSSRPARTRPTASSPSQARDRQGRDLAGAGRRLRRSARRSCLPASGAGAAACRARLADAAHQRRAGRPAAAAGRDATSTLRDGTLFSVLGFSDLTGLSVHRRALAARPRRPCRSARRSPSPTRCAATSRSRSAAGRALLIAHPYPGRFRLLTWRLRFSSSTTSA